MRSSFFFVFISLCLASAQEARMIDPQRDEERLRAALGELQVESESTQNREKIPTMLSEAHGKLEGMLSAEELAKIDAMSSEDDMVAYHMGLGARLRNTWGLWQGSALAQHLQELGFNHPDDMSAVILGTFWCKRHGQDFRLGERAAEYKKHREAAGESENRAQAVNAAIQTMMMGLRFEQRDVPRVPVPTRRGLCVRVLCPLRSGAFLTAYCQGRISSGLYAIIGGLYFDSTDGKVRTKPQYDDGVARGFYRDPKDGELHKMKPGEDFYTLGFYFDPADRKIHRIRVAEVNDVYATVVVGDRAWFAGLTDGKAVLAGIGDPDRDRVTVPLPEEDEIPDLGIDGESLLAVYSKTIYRLDGREWTVIRSSDILLPRSGLPPQRHGNAVYLRDEGTHETDKRLWWLTLDEPLHLSVLDRDLGLEGPYVVPLGRDVTCYCLTSSGDLWTCANQGTSLFRRTANGSYGIAIVKGSVQFSEDLRDRRTDQGLSVSAVAVLSDDTLLLAGETGLYRLRDNELAQELAFIPAESSGNNSGSVRPDWQPSAILALDDKSYLIGSDSWRGAYVISRDNDGQWSVAPVDTGDPIFW